MNCAHCAYYDIEMSIRSSQSNNICKVTGCRKRYYQTCKRFMWDAKYISINNERDEYDAEGHVLCRRCCKPLTDIDSIARKFGETCYIKRLHWSKKRSKRLF